MPKTTKIYTEKINGTYLSPKQMSLWKYYLKVNKIKEASFVRGFVLESISTLPEMLIENNNVEGVTIEDFKEIKEKLSIEKTKEMKF